MLSLVEGLSLACSWVFLVSCATAVTHIHVHLMHTHPLQINRFFTIMKYMYERTIKWIRDVQENKDEILEHDQWRVTQNQA